MSFRAGLSAATLIVLAVTLSGAELPPGPFYLVPVHEAELEVTQTSTREATFRRVDTDQVPRGREWDDLRGLLARFGPCVGFDTEEDADVVGSFSLVPLADASVGPVPLPGGGGAWTDFDGTVELTPEGFLAGVNASSVGRGPDVLVAVATTMGRLAAVASGLRARAPDPLENILESLRGEPEAFLDGRLACSRRPPRAVSSPSEALAIPAGEYHDADCPPFAGRFSSLASETRWALGASHRACAAMDALEKQAELVETIRTGLKELLGSAPGPDDPNGLRYQRRYEALSVSYAAEYPKLSTLGEDLGEALAAAVSGSGTSGRSVVEHRTRVPLDSLCSALQAGSEDGRTRCPEVWQALDQLGVSLAGEPTFAIGGSPPTAAWVAERLAAAPRRARTFFFRQPVPVRFQLLRCTGYEQASTTKRCTAFSADPPVVAFALHPGTRLSAMSLKLSAFGEAGLGIVFSELGVPKSFRLGSRSAAGAAASAVAEATGISRDEYLETLEALSDIRDTRRKLGLADLEDQIAALEKQQELLERAAEAESSGGSVLAAAMARAEAAATLSVVRGKLGAAAAEEALEAQAQGAALAARIAALERQVAWLEARLGAGGSR